ncbi:unnamed protein product, partial [Closterium sp. NIES-54]
PLNASSSHVMPCHAMPCHAMPSPCFSAGRSDSFTAGLLRIHAEIIKEGIQQPIRLGMHRPDYVLDTVTGGVLQVELNTESPHSSPSLPTAFHCSPPLISISSPYG